MPNTKDYLHLHFIVLIWGFTAILGLLIESVNSVELVFYRTFFSFSLLGILLYSLRHSLHVKRKDLLKILGTGALIGLHWILFFASAKVANASVCLAGMTTASFWASLIEPIAFKRRVKSYEIILGLIIMLGLYVIFRFEFNHGLGLILAIASAFLGALFAVINSKLIQKHHHYTITFYEMLGACIATILVLPIYSSFINPQQNTQIIPTIWTDWIYILILAGVCTVYAYSASVKLMHKFSAYAVSLTVNLEPIYGIILAFLFFRKSEEMTLGFYIGTFIILIAVLTYPRLDKHFSTAKMRKKRKKVLARNPSLVKPV